MDKLRKNRTLKKLRLFFSSSRRSKKLKSPECRSDSCGVLEGYGKPSVAHATVVIFLEFFSWGLLTSPTIQALKVAFPTGTFLKNGIVQGIKGILSFLSAPLIGALSDTWGRKSFLLLSVFFTCAPIPILLLSPTAYFVTVALSGIFSVTFSIAFAYVADCTVEKERSFSYGVVSATFAASLVISPALGTWLEQYDKGEARVVLLATLITVLNLCFIVFFVPESLQEASRKASWGSAISWEKADPFSSLRKASTDVRLLRLSLMVFLSYLPEAGQYSCFFLYLKQVVGFSLNEVASFIAVLCVSSVLAQTVGLSFLMMIFGYKLTIMVGLLFQACQLFIYGIWTAKWLMWTAGILASLSTITYPAISALVSRNAKPEQQGVVLGILTGMRGLCNGLGPAIFGLIFYLSHVTLSDPPGASEFEGLTLPSTTQQQSPASNKTLLHAVLDPPKFAGLPFLIGVVPVLLALLIALCISEKDPFLKPYHSSSRSHSPAPSSPSESSPRVPLTSNSS